MNDASQYQYGTAHPPHDLPYTGFGVILVLVGVCVASAIKERVR